MYTLFVTPSALFGRITQCKIKRLHARINIVILKVYGYTFKGSNSASFLFAFSSMGVSSLKKEFALPRANSFF